jgi:hypothetical protein
MPETVDMEAEAEPEAAAALVALGFEPSPSKLGEHSPSQSYIRGIFPTYLLKDWDLFKVDANIC